MSTRRDPDALARLQDEIATFVRALAHPVVFEDEAALFDLASAGWRLDLEFGKLVFAAWNPARTVSRRVEEIAYRDRGRLGVFARKPGGRATSTLEFRELEGAAPRERNTQRAAFSRAALAMLQREFPGWKLERVSRRSDREHSFSAWYTRGLARQGRTAWAFLALREDEALAAADALLAFALIWLDWLRAHAERLVIPGLKLVLPPRAVSLIAHRAAHLHPRAAQLEILAWTPAPSGPERVDVNDFGNVETRLTPRRQSELLLERHLPLLSALLGELFPQVNIFPDSSATFLSLRVRGLEVARLEGLLSPRLFFGLEGSVRKFEPDSPHEFREFVHRALEIRRAGSLDPSHPLYHLQAERWLESLLLRDITRIDPELRPDCVYPQVPAFAGPERGVIDLLAARRDGRLAVIELKLTEEINLPFQGLDYWLRVKWLQERRQFQEFGYFPGLSLTGEPPVLYLVSPAFRFHSSLGTLVRYFHPDLQVVQVGINDSWREEPRTLFRRDLRRTRSRALTI